MEILTVRTCLGDERLVTRTYADGSAECPFCSYPITPGQSHNPWCDAHPGYTPEKLQAQRDTRAAAEREGRDRRANHASAMRRIAEERESREAWEHEQYAEARRRGACLRCLFGASSGVHFVKHRGPCPRDKRAGCAA
jgi:hypothetical protein